MIVTPVIDFFLVAGAGDDDNNEYQINGSNLEIGQFGAIGPTGGPSEAPGIQNKDFIRVSAVDEKQEFLDEEFIIGVIYGSL